MKPLNMNGKKFLSKRIKWWAVILLPLLFAAITVFLEVFLIK